MRTSAGIIAYRKLPELQVLLIHPGGPYYQNRWHGVWSFPKGEVCLLESNESCAVREFKEETSLDLGDTPDLIDLGEVSTFRKRYVMYAIQRDFDLSNGIVSNTFKMEWPKGSGKEVEFPEADLAQYFSLADAETRIHPNQKPFLHRLAKHLGIS